MQSRLQRESLVPATPPQGLVLHSRDSCREDANAAHTAKDPARVAAGGHGRHGTTRNGGRAIVPGVDEPSDFPGPPHPLTHDERELSTLHTEDKEITLDTGNCGSSDCLFSVDGRRFYFWSWTTDDRDPSIEDGLGEFQYMASLGFSSFPTDINARTWFVFGVRTRRSPDGHRHPPWTLSLLEFRDS